MFFKLFKVFKKKTFLETVKVLPLSTKVSQRCRGNFQLKVANLQQRACADKRASVEHFRSRLDSELAKNSTFAAETILTIRNSRQVSTSSKHISFYRRLAQRAIGVT